MTSLSCSSRRDYRTWKLCSPPCSKAAQFLGQADRRGTIETGKAADLVLLDRDPLADIRNTRSIRTVVLNGKLLERAILDKMLVDVEASAN
jgi:cytosine/adenosine deaminase-related metal-dependent hydrolase